jgi:hypothetical protein
MQPISSPVKSDDTARYLDIQEKQRKRKTPCQTPHQLNVITMCAIRRLDDPPYQLPNTQKARERETEKKKRDQRISLRQTKACHENADELCCSHANNNPIERGCATL